MQSSNPTRFQSTFLSRKIFMFAGVLFFFLHSIGTAGAQDAPAAAKDPFANPGRANAEQPEKPGEPVEEGSNSFEEDSSMQCEQRSCEVAGKSLIYTMVAIDAVGLLAAILIWFFFTKKVWFHGPFQRFIIAGGLAAVAAMVVIALNPFADNVLKCCLASGDMVRFLTFSSIVTKPWIAGLVMGAVPVMVSFFIFMIIQSIVSRFWRK